MIFRVLHHEQLSYVCGGPISWLVTIVRWDFVVTLYALLCPIMYRCLCSALQPKPYQLPSFIAHPDPGEYQPYTSIHQFFFMSGSTARTFRVNHSTFLSHLHISMIIIKATTPSLAWKGEPQEQENQSFQLRIAAIFPTRERYCSK